MFQVRFHGRGGQGVVTAAELLSVERADGVEIEDGVVRVGADLMAGCPGVFAGGDIVPAERTVTMAIGHGRDAARGIDAYLRGERFAPPPPGPPATFDALNPWYYDDAPRTVRPTLAAARRQSTFDEVTGGLEASTALFEARRCLSCGSCFACDNCYGDCPDNAVIKLEPAGALRPRLLQGLRSVRAGVPVRGDRDAAGADLMSELAGAADVLDHRFGAGRPFTVGVEEEYMLLDPETFDLVPRAERILAAEAGGEFAANVSPELFESLVEFHTPVCDGIADVDRELRRIRSHAVAAAQAQGLRLGSAGTHPFSLFERQRIMDRDRYRVLIDELQYAGRRELIYGLHVHVAVDDPDRAIRIVNALRAHLCELVALSANSPFWRGEPTGFASCRHLIFSAFPRSGPPPHFASYAEYAAVIGQLVASGSIEDYTRTWWDVRPHPRFGTVEVRVMDAVTRVEDAIALAAYVQSLVRHYAEAPAGTCHPVIANENKWRAARYGLDAIVTDVESDGPIPVAELIERSLAAIAPHARELGCERELAGIERILRDGNGAARQLAVQAATGEVRRVLQDIAEVTQIARRW